MCGLDEDIIVAKSPSSQLLHDLSIRRSAQNFEFEFHCGRVGFVVIACISFQMKGDRRAGLGRVPGDNNLCDGLTMAT